MAEPSICRIKKLIHTFRTGGNIRRQHPKLIRAIRTLNYPKPVRGRDMVIHVLVDTRLGAPDQFQSVNHRPRQQRRSSIQRGQNLTELVNGGFQP
jgi:hypothetical protein